jgi:Na+/pantothenate symporter
MSAPIAASCVLHAHDTAQSRILVPTLQLGVHAIGALRRHVFPEVQTKT